METWLDAASNLPVAGERSEWEEGRWVQKQEYSVRYDEEVPVAVLTYAPPDAAHTVHDFAIDPRFEEWHLHLRRLAARYQQKPLPERMELVPRETDEEIPAYRMANLPGLRDYAVEALGRTGPWPFTLKSLVDRWRPAGSLRVPREFQSLELVSRFGQKETTGKGQQIPVRVRQVAPQTKAVLHEAAGTWKESQSHGEIEVTVTLMDGGRLIKTVRW